VSSATHDSVLTVSERDFKVDGLEAIGHLYQWKMRKNESQNEASVALIVSATSFDMKKVVDHYETIEEPVYENRPKLQVRNK